MGIRRTRKLIIVLLLVVMVLVLGHVHALRRSP